MEIKSKENPKALKDDKTMIKDHKRQRQKGKKSSKRNRQIKNIYIYIYIEREREIEIFYEEKREQRFVLRKKNMCRE